MPKIELGGAAFDAPRAKPFEVAAGMGRVEVEEVVGVAKLKGLEVEFVVPVPKREVVGTATGAPKVYWIALRDVIEPW
jgi:hypothetical protein